MQVYRQAQRYTDSFLDLQKLVKLAPDDAELLEQLQEAARLCLHETDDGSKVRIWHSQTSCSVSCICCLQAYSRFILHYAVTGKLCVNMLQHAVFLFSACNCLAPVCSTAVHSVPSLCQTWCCISWQVQHIM